MNDNRNTILAVILSGLVLIGWQYFFKHSADGEAARRAAGPERDGEARNRRPPRVPPPPQTGARAPRPSANAPAANQPAFRRHPSAAIPPLPSTPRGQDRHPPRLTGSISLKGARIDDLALVQFRETVEFQIRRRSCCTRPRARLSPITAEFGLGACGGLDGEASRSGHAVAAGRLGQPDAEQPGGR